MIVANQITKAFNGAEAVKSVSFEVKSGETLVLLGTSGCGKTTTLKMLNRLIEPTSGKITINGQDVMAQRPEILRRSIGYVSQNDGLFPHFTVFQNIAIVPALLKWSKPEIRQRSESLLEKLQLSPDDFGNKYPSELSGGQKQRVAVARAIISDPPIILMDEPFGALDPVTRSQVRKEFGQLPELKEKTIVLVTHDVQEAVELADRVALMENGKIAQHGTASELLFKPVNHFVKSFFDNQRLYLELKASKLKDLWNNLPPTENTNHVPVSGDEDLWEMLEQILQSPLKELVLSYKDEYRMINTQTIHDHISRKGS